jgi:hypothetical protein
MMGRSHLFSLPLSGEVILPIGLNFGLHNAIIFVQLIKFNLTSLESTLFLLVCLAINIWTKHGCRLRPWWQLFFGQHSRSRDLKCQRIAELQRMERELRELHRLGLSSPTDDVDGKNRVCH